MREIVDRCFERHLQVAEKVRAELVGHVAAAAEALTNCLAGGGKVLLCGNGGSAADAQHIAAELTGRYLLPNRRPLPAVALTTDSSALTAIGNDFGFESIFSRQVQALAAKGDALLAISTSGNSPNVVKALESAREIGCVTVALTGKGGGKMKDLADFNLIVPSDETPQIQEMHIMIGHVLCDLIDQYFDR
jgi:D-sedoheptulose 7-phosphate isomerase